MLRSFDIEGESRGATGNGSAAPAGRTAPLLTRLQQAGAHGTAKAATPDLNLGRVEFKMPPVACKRAACANSMQPCSCASGMCHMNGYLVFACWADHPRWQEAQNLRSPLLSRLLGALEEMPANPAAAECVTGGAGAACASAVAAGEVQFAIGVDHLAGIRVRMLAIGGYDWKLESRGRHDRPSGLMSLSRHLWQHCSALMCNSSIVPSACAMILHVLQC